MNVSLARERLLKNAQAGATLTYREFAVAVGITKAPIIRTSTAILEELMSQDAATKRPILAALVVQRNSNAIPRSGFYQMLNHLGIYSGEAEGAAAAQWHQAEVEKLIKYYQSGN